MCIGHDLDGVALALEALHVPLLGRRHHQPLAQRRQAPDHVAERPRRAGVLGRQHLEEVPDVHQPARALAEEQLAQDDAALVEDARVEPPERLARGGGVPGEEAREERMVAVGGDGRGEIGQRQPEERRQPGAQPLGRIARIGDRAQQIAHLPRLGRARRAPPGCR